MVCCLSSELYQATPTDHEYIYIFKGTNQGKRTNKRNKTPETKPLITADHLQMNAITARVLVAVNVLHDMANLSFRCSQPCGSVTSKSGE